MEKNLNDIKFYLFLVLVNVSAHSCATGFRNFKEDESFERILEACEAAVPSSEAPVPAAPAPDADMSEATCEGE